MRKVVLLSGGMDSTTLLAKSKDEGDAVVALSINYGQRHFKELEAAKRIAGFYNVPHHTITLPGWEIFKNAESSQVGQFADLPEGKYDADSMKKTVVPNRNMILLAVAEAFAISQKADFVEYAAHAGDHAIYPDCRPQFVRGIQSLVEHCDWNPVPISAPFLSWSKAEIVKLGLDLQVPYEFTWTCYAGKETSCGRCGTCVERIEAFAICQAVDPLPYTDPDYWLSVCQH